jgi:antitoxin component YwqK of YwqJK toxin-antitoxin module
MAARFALRGLMGSALVLLGACDSCSSKSVPAEVGKDRWPNGELRSVTPLDTQGRPHGTVRGFYRSGKRQFESGYHHGRRHGTTTFWLESGQRESVREYRNGVAHGEFQDWHENGTRAAAGTYEDGANVELRCWDESGAPLAEARCATLLRHPSGS